MYDIIIIGSGPAGLSAAVYAGRAQLKAVVAERFYGSAGQITDSEQVDNYLGLYGESGLNLEKNFVIMHWLLILNFMKARLLA